MLLKKETVKSQIYIMNEQFKPFENDINALRPNVKQRALDIAKQLLKSEGYDPQAALQEGIRRAEQQFLDEEG